MNDYLTVVYDDKLHPYTDYSNKFSCFIFKHYGIQSGKKKLEPGCGRGEMLKGFRQLGLHVRGNDLSQEAVLFSPDIQIDVCDVEKNGLSYTDNSFDIIYSKSFLEHFYYLERYIKEAFRGLNPVGVILNLVSDWEANYRKYFHDYTHRTPFTTVSLCDIQLIHGFEDVKVVKFRQFPLLWGYPSLKYLCGAMAFFIPLWTQGTLRWVREIMLIGSGRKPRLEDEKK